MIKETEIVDVLSNQTQMGPESGGDPPEGLQTCQHLILIHDLDIELLGL